MTIHLEKPHLIDTDEVFVVCSDAQAAEAKATELEAQAQRLRENAGQQRIRAFAGASAQLMRLHANGLITDSEAVRHAYQLEDIDLGMGIHGRGEHIADMFDLLQPGTPVVGVTTLSEHTRSGIVLGEPQRVSVVPRHTSGQPSAAQPFMAPRVTAELPLRIADFSGRTREEVAEIEVGHLDSKGTIIGRWAIQAAIDAIEFGEACDQSASISTNGDEIHTLWSQVNSLTKLDDVMFNTANLDRVMSKFRAWQRDRDEATKASILGSRRD